MHSPLANVTVIPESAAESTARSAAESAFADTVNALQASAVELVERMIAEGEKPEAA